MKKMGDMQILPPDNQSVPYQKDSESTQGNSSPLEREENEWIIVAAANIVATLCLEPLDFKPRTEEQENEAIQAYAIAFFAQGECNLREEIDGPRFAQVISLCPGRFRKFPPPRDIMDLLPLRPQRKQLMEKVDKTQRKAMKDRHISNINALFDDCPSCDEIAATRDEPVDEI